MKYDEKELFVRAYYPYDTTTSPNYELTMIGQVIGGMCSAIIYPSVDTFIAMLVLHACGQITNLKNELREIPHEKTDVETKLKKIVQKHNYIARFVETIEENFNMMLLIQMLACIVQICFQSFQALMVWKNLTVYKVYINRKKEYCNKIKHYIRNYMYVIIQCYIVLYNRTIFFFQYNLIYNIAEATYHCMWYNLPPEIARPLIIIMCRARASPLKLTAGKFYLNYQYGWNRSIMKYAGIWPEERKWNRPSSYIVLIPFLSMLCFACAPQTINLPFIIHDLNLVVENLSNNVTFTLSLMKTVAIWMNSKSLKSLLKCIAKDWATVETKTERETMVNVARVTRMIMIGCSMMCQLVVASYVILRLIFMQHDDNKMFIRGYYPYDTTVRPNYELTMIGQAIAGAYSASIYSSVDTFVAMLILHACGQISNLKNDLREMHSYDKVDLRTKLKKIVEKHNYINRFVLKGNY
ncbi:Putative odorant receptor 13a [Melipona quadrifasciata]|uniref:Odorant receptor n=1 Tax=Melipona quadrifasciata TaxID=166423 RepID=A0A0N1IT82_9HYME|nr:Putative odorant receptor 13a [Melipona quadrifasciata]